MPIASIAQQPTTSSIHSPYNALVYKVVATDTGGGSTPPMVKCEIYANGAPFSTIERTAPESSTAINSTFSFDVSERSLLFFKKNVPVNGMNSIFQDDNNYFEIECKFYSSGLDVNGFLAIESAANTSGKTYVVNCVLQHEDNINLPTHLAAYQTGTWASGAFPLTHRPAKLKICAKDSDSFPFIYLNRLAIETIDLTYRLHTSTSFQSAQFSIAAAPPIVHLIQVLPTGKKDLKLLFPTIDFANVAEYYVQATRNGLAICTTPTYYHGCCTKESLRIRFQNHCGQFDGITFDDYKILYETKSENYKIKKPDAFAKSDYGRGRFNVSGQKVYECRSFCYDEKDMPWIMELQNSIGAFLEVTGLQQQNDSCVPIVIQDVKMVPKKLDNEDRFSYETIVSFIKANDVKTIY